MNINLSKTLTQLAPLQISDFIDVEFAVIKEVAAKSNGQFMLDRNTLPASEFLNKYFPEYAVIDTVEAMEVRRKAALVASKPKKAKKETILDQYGNYVVALWECGDEFTASYRKTSSMTPQWHILSKHEVEYKTDGRKFSIVEHTTSRKDALLKKNKLVEEMVARGMTYKGELPV